MLSESVKQPQSLQTKLAREVAILNAAAAATDSEPTGADALLVVLIVHSTTFVFCKPVLLPQLALPFFNATLLASMPAISPPPGVLQSVQPVYQQLAHIQKQFPLPLAIV